MIKVSK